VPCHRQGYRKNTQSVPLLQSDQNVTSVYDTVRLDDLDTRNGGPIRTSVWDSAELQRLLRMDEARRIAATYFPNRNFDVERLVHEMQAGLSLLQDYHKILSQNIDKPPSPEVTAHRRLAIQKSAALSDSLQFQVKGLLPDNTEQMSDKRCILDRQFWDHIVGRAQVLASIDGSPPIALTLDMSVLEPVCEIRMPAEALERIILEMVSNAVRYRKPGETPMIQISRRDEPESTALFIDDCGIGISALAGC
jgi:K+-sensing histidine kinase KdpD